MKTLLSESNVDLRAALRDRIFVAAEHIRNHPDNIASQFVLLRAENCIVACGLIEQLM
jgi:hypothetical protein